MPHGPPVAVGQHSSAAFPFTAAAGSVQSEEPTRLWSAQGADYITAACGQLDAWAELPGGEGNETKVLRVRSETPKEHH